MEMNRVGYKLGRLTRKWRVLVFVLFLAGLWMTGSSEGESELSKLQVRVYDAEADAHQAQQEVSELKDKVSDLEGKIEQIEAEMP